MHPALSPAQVIARLLALRDEWLRARLLRRARAACRVALAELDGEHLAAVEQGWADEWHLRHNDLRETLAHIEQAQATC